MARGARCAGGDHAPCGGDAVTDLVEVQASTYYDSVTLMAVSREARRSRRH